MRTLKKIFLALLVLCAMILTSCVSSKKHGGHKKTQDQPEAELPIEPAEEKVFCSRSLSAPAVKTAEQLAAFFEAENPEPGSEFILQFARYYIEECADEGINSDCAFVQMCLETGFLRFGNLVTPDMHNYCGLGAIDIEHPGEVFETERDGVRAHVQHLHAYATTADKELKNPLIDRRYRYVSPRGKAPSIFELAGTWAMDKKYGEKLDGLLTRLEGF